MRQGAHPTYAVDGQHGRHTRGLQLGENVRPVKDARPRDHCRLQGETENVCIGARSVHTTAPHLDAVDKVESRTCRQPVTDRLEVGHPSL